jgi:hypothetical protein
VVAPHTNSDSGSVANLVNDRFNHYLNTMTCTSLGMRRVTNITDCENAISLIPSGRLCVHPEENRLRTPGRLNRHLNLSESPDSKTRYHHSLPKSFRSGSCAISIEPQLNAFPYAPNGPNLDGPQAAATALHYNIWPAARRIAANIVSACRMYEPESSNIGWATFLTILEDKRYYFAVAVLGNRIEKHDAQQRTNVDENTYKVYDPAEHDVLYIKDRSGSYDKRRPFWRGTDDRWGTWGLKMKRHYRFN